MYVTFPTYSLPLSDGGKVSILNVFVFNWDNSYQAT